MNRPVQAGTDRAREEPDAGNAHQSTALRIAIIIAARNAGGHLHECLHTILSGSRTPDELILVDDASTDDTPLVARAFPVHLICLDTPSGPATARNLGAARAVATGNGLLLFLDADVLLAPTALEHIHRRFTAERRLDALQGVYQLPSRNHNLCTAYMDELVELKTAGLPEQTTGIVRSYCFAIRNHLWQRTGGFDKAITRATVEDNDLGYRLAGLNTIIHLDRHCRVQHVKRYTLRNLLRRSFVTNSDRLKLLLRKRTSPGPPPTGSLVLTPKKTFRRFTAGFALAPVVITTAIAGLLLPFARPAILPVAAAFVLLYLPVLNGLRTRRGALFAMQWLLIHLLDATVGAAGLVHGTVDYIRGRTY